MSKFAASGGTPPSPPVGKSLIFIIDAMMKTNPWTSKMKDSNREKIIGSFYEKELLLSTLQMSCYPNSGSHIRDKVKVVKDLPNYATREELKDATGVDTPNFVAKRSFIALTAKVDKLDINK